MRLRERIFFRALFYPVMVFCGMYSAMMFSVPKSQAMAAELGIPWFPPAMAIGGLVMAILGIVMPALEAWRDYRTWKPFLDKWESKKEIGHV